MTSPQVQTIHLPAVPLTARIRPKFRRNYPVLTGDWYPVLKSDDVGVSVDLGRAGKRFVFREHAELRERGA